LNCSKRNFNKFQIVLSDMNMQDQFNKMSVFECQTISENTQKLKQEKFKDFQVLLYKFKDIQGLECLFSNSIYIYIYWIYIYIYIYIYILRSQLSLFEESLGILVLIITYINTRLEWSRMYF
jgi:hypothetical protein